jgi:hypothetical protein
MKEYPNSRFLITNEAVANRILREQGETCQFVKSLLA